MQTLNVRKAFCDLCWSLEYLTAATVTVLANCSATKINNRSRKKTVTRQILMNFLTVRNLKSWFKSLVTG